MEAREQFNYFVEELIFILRKNIEAKHFIVFWEQQEGHGPLSTDSLPEARENLQQESMKPHKARG